MNRVFVLACIALALIQHPASNDQIGNKGQENTRPAQGKVGAAPIDQDTSKAKDKGQNNEVKVSTLPDRIRIQSVKDNVDWTVLICTLILTVVGIVGARAAIKTLNQIKRQADTLDEHKAKFEELATAARDNALAAKRLAEISETTLVTTFRPRLIIRKVFLNPGTAIPTVGVPDAYPWKVDYVIVNIGGTNATIRRSGFAFTAFPDGIPARLPYEMQEPSDTIQIEPGSERELSVGINDNLTSLFRMLGIKGENLSHQKIGHAYFWGCAQYADERGVIRNVAVCRHYELETTKFKAVDDPDYEYAD